MTSLSLMMADTDDQAHTTESPNKRQIARDVYQEAIEVSSLAHYARVQANEAEMRARQAMTLAERALFEAESVHEVAESLTFTARTVAKMALDIANREGIVGTLSEAPTDKISRQLTGSSSLDQDSSNIFKHIIKKPSKQTSPQSDCESGSGLLLASTAIQGVEQKNSNPSPTKFTEPFPEQISTTDNTDGGTRADLTKEFDSSHSLPIVWENSYQGPKEVKPMPWSEKKSLRKIQRKLREIEVGVDNGEERTSTPTRGGRHENQPVPTGSDMKSPISKEKLVSSVRFSEEHALTIKNEDKDAW